MRVIHFCLLSALVLHAGQAAEIKLHRWSGDLNVPDPVACCVDEKGRVYVAATTRRKAADLDIREHPLWIPDDVSLTSVEEKSAFLKRELAPGKVRVPRGGLKDHNRDGNIDWKDLTVHSERIYQLRDTDGDGTADKMSVFAEGFNTEVTGIAAGILYHDGWVYATIAPDLWRLKDSDDDGVADVREVVAHGFGMHIAYAGHDMHGPRLGPDGRIYWSIGDKGVNVTSKEGKKWFYPHEGCVMRVEPDGTGFEVFAHGLRNVQEVAFDAFGNMFGVDNDADLPGERERFVYITEQSDSGWRCSHQYMKAESRWMRESIWRPQGQTATKTSNDEDDPIGQPLFVTPPLANYSNGPAGLVYEPGTAMGEGLRGQFILSQFPSGKMDAFAIEPDGAAFKMTNLRTINSGIMGIGLNWGPDGALYMADWMGGYPLDEKGAIWRIDDDLEAAGDLRKETQTILAEGFDKRDTSNLQTLLGHADQRIRIAAELELAKREAWDALLTTARDSNAPLLARVHAVWGYGIGFRKGKMDETGLHEMLVVAKEPEMQAQIAKVISEGKITRTTERALIDLLKSDSPRVRFHAALAVGRLGLADAGLYLLDLAGKDARDPWLRHALVTGLAGCMTPELLAERANATSAAERLVCALALARTRSPLIAAFLDDPEADILDEVTRAIHDDQGIPDALPKLAKLLEEERPLPGNTFRRAINANLRLGELVNAARLLQYALRHQPPEALTALQTLVNFTEPRRLDPVDGAARPQMARDPTGIAVNVVQPWRKDLLALTDPDMKAGVIELMIKTAMKMEAPALSEIIADADAKPNLRIGALKLMAAQHPDDPAFAKALAQAGQKSSPVELRMEALAQTLSHQGDKAIGEVSRVLEQGTLAEKQAALKLLSRTRGKEAEGLMDAWILRLAAGKVEAGLKLDVIEAGQAHPALADRVMAFQHSRTSAPRDDLLEGGNSAIGKDIVTNHLGANCLGCHTVEEKNGSQVGPLLKGIGAVRTRAELLESIVNPVAKIASGFGLVSVYLKDGSNLSGMLLEEDKSAITLRMADGSQKKLDRDDINMQTPPVSMMPPMLGILTPREVRDVLAYLASLQTKPDKVMLARLEEHATPKPAAKGASKPASASVTKAEMKRAAASIQKSPASEKSLPKAIPLKLEEATAMQKIDVAVATKKDPDVPRKIETTPMPQEKQTPPAPPPETKSKKSSSRTKPVVAEASPEPKPAPPPDSEKPAPAATPTKRKSKSTAKVIPKAEPVLESNPPSGPAMAAKTDGSTEAKPADPAAAPPSAPAPEKPKSKSFFSRFRSKPKAEPVPEPIPEPAPPAPDAKKAE